MFKYVVLITIASAVALPNPDEGKSVDSLRGIKKDCANGLLNPGCLKMGAITLLEKLNNKDEVSLIPGVSLVKDGDKSNYEAVAADLARSFGDSDDRLDKSLLYHVGSFLDSHSVKLRLLDDNAVEEAKTAMAEGRAKGGSGLGGGKKGGMGGLIAMAMMMKG